MNHKITLTVLVEKDRRVSEAEWVHTLTQWWEMMTIKSWKAEVCDTTDEKLSIELWHTDKHK